MDEMRQRMGMKAGRQIDDGRRRNGGGEMTVVEEGVKI